ncbi:MAG: HAMP domain-containing protein [Alphaproteobacteria bacterium]|nr:HAMP domain-containing protein [Alphaproteobacteria bacterium]
MVTFNDKKFSSVSLSIGQKLIGGMLVGFGLVLGLLVFSSERVTGQLVHTAQMRELGTLADSLKDKIAQETMRAQAMAQMLADSPPVQAAFAARDRSQLEGLTLSGFPELKQTFGVRQVQFHTAPAVSFLRVHRPEKFGDDLSGFRHSVVQANETGKAQLGPEAGVAGLGIRAVLPMKHQGQQVGSVEVGLSLGQAFVDDFAQPQGVELIIYQIQGDQLKILGKSDGAKTDFEASVLKARMIGDSLLPAFEYQGKPYAASVQVISDFAGKPAALAVLQLDQTDYIAEIASSRENLIIATLMTLGVGALLITYVTISILRPIQKTTTSVNELADGNYDIEVAYLDRKDEIGSLAAALSVFQSNIIEREKLEQEIAQEKEEALRQEAAREAEEHARQERERQEKEAARIKAEQERADMLQALANDFEASVKVMIDEVVETVGACAFKTQELRSKIDEASGLMNTVSSASDKASSDVGSVASGTEELSTSVSEIAQQVARSHEVTSAAQNLAQDARTDIEGLESATLKINAVINLINDIAEQTNLLALNATIEAARAGEAGRGFAVVANEVKALADQTRKATEDIRDPIEALQSSSDTVVQSMTRIMAAIDEASSTSGSISAAVEEQNAATQEIARAAQSAADATATASGSVDGALSALEQNVGYAVELSDAADVLDKVATDMSEKVDTFLQTVRSSASA